MLITKITRPSVGADLSCPAPIMRFTNQDRSCHPERSEGSVWPGTEILRGVYPERREGLRMATYDRTWLVNLIIGLSRCSDIPRNLLMCIIAPLPFCHYVADQNVNAAQNILSLTGTRPSVVKPLDRDVSLRSPQL